MPANDAVVGYRIWGVDHVVYGPVELPVLVDWIRDERVAADTWVFAEAEDQWCKAAQMPELQLLFQKRAAVAASRAAAQAAEGAASVVGAGTLRRLKILADLTEPQLTRFAEMLEVQSLRQWAEIVKQGSPGDGMFFLLEGEVRVRLMVGGKESILATLGPGDFFGETSLFDHGPRSADVVANKDSVVLRLSAADFHRLVTSLPDLAAPFLYAMGRTLVARIRADNKRFRDSVAFARASH